MNERSFDAAEHIGAMISDVWQVQPDTVVRLFQTLAQTDPELARAIQQILNSEIV